MGLFAERAKKKEEELNKALGKKMVYADDKSTSSLNNATTKTVVPTINKTEAVKSASDNLSNLERASRIGNIEVSDDIINRGNNVVKGLGTSTLGSLALIGQGVKQAYEEQQERFRRDGIAETLGTYARNLENPDFHFESKPMDTNTKAFELMDKSQQYYQDALEGLSPAQQFLGQTGISMLDNLTTLPLAVINPALPLVAMSAKATGNRAYELAKEGKSATEALGRGFVSGAIEGMTEMTPLDELLDVIKHGGKVGQIALKQALSEGGEEALSYLLNYGADKLAGDDVDFSLAELGLSGLGGVVSGGLMGTGGAMVGNLWNSSIYKNIGQKIVEDNIVEEVIQTGLESAPDTESHKLAQQLQSKIEAGGTVDEVEIGELYVENTKAIEEEEKASFKASYLGQIEDVSADDKLTAETPNVAEIGSQEATQPINNVVLTNEDKMRNEAQRRANEVGFENAIRTLGDNGAKALGSTYKPTDNFDKFYKDFSTYYEAGSIGTPMDIIDANYKKVDTQLKLSAYMAGQKDAEVSFERDKANAKVYTNGEFISGTAPKNVSSDTLAVLNSLAKATGNRIRFEDKVYGGKANGQYLNGEITIAKDAEKPFYVVAKHEVTHGLQVTSPVEYRAYRNYAVQLAEKTNGRSISVVEQYKLRAKNAGINLTTEQAMDEIAADFTEKILKDGKTLEQFIEENIVNSKSMLQKFFDAVHDFIKKVKDAFNGNRASMNKAAIKEFGLTISELEKAEKMWLNAVKATYESSKNAQQNKASEVENVGNTHRQFLLKDSNGNIRFSLKNGETVYAPPMYSQLERTVEQYKGNKISADGLIPYLKGKGVKDEEIKWSGIANYIEGKKSIAKDELLGFVRANELYIDEEVLEGNEYVFVTANGEETLETEEDFEAYVERYVENDLFMDAPDEVTYSYDDDRWTAIGHYEDEDGDQWTDVIMMADREVAPVTNWEEFTLYNSEDLGNYRELLFVMPDSSYSNQMMKIHWGDDAEGILAHARVQDMVDPETGEVMLFVEEIQSDWHNEGKKKGYKGDNVLSKNDTTPDAPFKDSYVNYVLKRLIRDCAERGIGKLAWATSEIQVDRWSEDFREGYRIEYDQEIPKFLKKYGKQWGAKLGQTELDGYTVPYIEINNKMRESVLYEGQPMFSLKDSNGNQLTEAQAEFFKDSKVRDENGNLKVVYHGTPEGGFTVFDSSKSHFTTKPSPAFFFSDNEDLPNKYYTEGKNKQVYSVYLNITNPLIINANGAGWNDVPLADAMKGADEFKYYHYLRHEWAYTETSTTDKIAKWAKRNGYDGVIFESVRDGSIHEDPSTVYAVFDSNQIKNTDNLNPTDDDDIRYSLKGAEEQAHATSKLISDTDTEGTAVISKKDGTPVAMIREDGNAQFSLKTYKENGRAELESWLNERVEDGNVARDQANDIIKQMDEYYNICKTFANKYSSFGAWSNAEVVVDEEGKPVFSVVKANGEYKMNLDFSLVCKKRRTLDAVFKEMIERGIMDDVKLGEAEIASINDIIRSYNFETACTLCFVDSKRYRQAKVADSFVKKYNKLVNMLLPNKTVSAHHFDFVESGNYNDEGVGLHTLSDSEVVDGINKLKQYMKTVKEGSVPYKIAQHLINNPQDRKLVSRSDFMNTDGFGAVLVKNPAVLSLYNSSKGSGGPKASFSDVQYLGEILKKSNFTPAKAYAVGGVRIQSFSDYVANLVFDYLQMFADLAAKKLPAHAYTKEELFVLQFGLTGAKINMSLVPAVVKGGVAAGLDANGDYAWYDGQSFGSDVNVAGSANRGFDLAVKIQNAEGYSKNCGTIAVGVSKKHILKMLDDENVRMIIPYHKSSLNKVVAQMNNIDKYEDYTRSQNTRYRNTGKKIEVKDFNFNEALMEHKSAKAAAKAYLDWCEDNNFIPKFDEFDWHENYYKLLEDFSTYDGNKPALQGAVTMTYPTKDSAFGSMAELIERGLKEHDVLEGRKKEKVPEIVDKIEEALAGGRQLSLKDTGNILKENAQLKEYNEYLKSQMKLTKEIKVDQKELKRLVNSLSKEYGTAMPKDEMFKRLDELYTYMQNEKELTFDDAKERAIEVARDIVSESVAVDDDLYNRYVEIRDFIRKARITLSEEDRRSVAGGYNNFRKANMGRVNLANDGISVDRFYQQLSELYPDIFDAEKYTFPADQLENIVDELNRLRNAYEYNPYDADTQSAVEWMANDLIDRYFDVPQAKPTYADKQKAKYDKQRRTQVSNAIKREREFGDKRLSELRKEKNNKIKEIRKKRDEKIKALKEAQKKRVAKMSDKRKRKILRDRIARHTKDLSTKLLKGSDKSHVPHDLRMVVVAVIDAINLESSYSYDSKTGKLKKNTKGEPTKRTNAFRELKEQYEAIKDKEYEVSMVIDPALLGDTENGSMIDAVIKMKDTRISDMTLEELETVWKVIRAVEKSITSAGKTLSDSKYATTKGWAEAFKNDTFGRKERKSNPLRNLSVDLETPYTFFAHFGQAGKDFFRMLRNAQDKQQVLQSELAERVQKVVSKEKREALEKDIVEYTTEKGDKLILSKAHLMEIYLLSKRKQARGHLLGDGIVQPKIKGKTPEGSKGILLTENDLNDMEGLLNAEEKKIADGLQKATLFLAEKGNEASMLVFGYEKFNDPNYWTIKSSSLGLNQTVDKGQNQPRSIKNMGSAKGLTENARNSLSIGGVFNTFDAHASDMITYSAWLAPMEDANRLFNFSFRDANKKPTGEKLKGILRTYAGEKAEQYWLNLMKDIQNGIASIPDDNISPLIERTIGKVKGASVASNIRVVVQQPTAFFRAGVVLSPDNMLRGMTKGVNEGNGWEKAKKYAPIAQMKAVGGFEVSNSPTQLSEVLYAPETKKGKVLEGVKELPTMGASKADAVTWGAIWNACEWQVHESNESLDVGSDEFNKAVAELFTEVIDQTQVVDGVLQRSQTMRSSSWLNKQASSFMGEPTLSLNLLMRSYDNWKSQTDTKKRTEARKKMGQAVFALMLSNFAVAVAQSSVDGLRDDDEEKKYLERFLSALTGIQGDEESLSEIGKNMLLDGNLGESMNVAAWIPYVKDIFSILQGYDVERLDASAISDFVSAANNSIKSLSGEGKWSKGYALSKMFMTGAKLFGSSASNVVRDIESIVRSVFIETENWKALYDMKKQMYNMKTQKGEFMDVLYKAYEDNLDDYTEMYNDLLEQGISEKDIKSAMESRMKKAQNVDSVYELEERWFSPSQQKETESVVNSAKKSSLWNKASQTQKAEFEAGVYEILNDKETQAKMKEIGMDTTDYALFNLALSVYDEPNKNGNYGTYTNKETAEAILNTPNLTDKEMASLWNWEMDDDNILDALAKGYDIDTYLEVKADTTGLKKAEKREYLNDMDISDDEYKFYRELLKL